MAEPVDKDVSRHPVWGAAAEPERPRPFAGRFPAGVAPDPEDADPMDPPPPWLAQGEEWLRWYADMRSNPSRYMP